MSSKTRAILLTLLVIAGLILANFVIQVGVDPSYKSMGVDSGTFAYCGQVIHDGGLMYRDCWDNKPPGVYYLDALAISLGGSNPFAIWLFQAVWFGVAVVAFFLVMDRVWEHKGIAALGAFTLLFFVLYPDIFKGGNFTETYAVLPVVLALGAFWAYLRTGRQFWLVALGVLAAASFLLKPTYIAVALSSTAVIAFLALKRRAYRRMVIDLGIIALSAFVPLALVALYFVFQQDFGNLWFAVFTHNFTYVEQGLSLTSLYGTARMFLVQQPMGALTILVGIAAAVFIYQHGRSIFSIKKPADNDLGSLTPGEMVHDQALTWFMSGVFFSLVLDVLFLASSGRNFTHYLQVLLPGMVVAMLYLIDVLRRSLLEERLSRTLQVALISAVIVVLLGGGLEIAAKEKPNFQLLKSFITSTARTAYQPSELEQYIIDHSAPGDSVLIWAGHPGMNFVTHRRSPTRYIFLLHLFTPTPHSPNGFTEFLQELQSDPPKLIVTQPVSSIGLPNFEDPASAMCPACDDSSRAGMLAFKTFIAENYELKFSIWDWEVYQSHLP